MPDRDAFHPPPVRDRRSRSPGQPVRDRRSRSPGQPVLIPERLLVVGDAFGAELDASAVCEAIAGGVEAAGRRAPDVCPIVVAGRPDEAGKLAEDPRTLLDGLDFDARMHRARAVVMAWEELHERALAGSIAFEMATRARQGGVPCYAVTRRNRLERFDARILDLQAVIEADGVRALSRAGTKLARLAWPGG